MYILNAGRLRKKVNIYKYSYVLDEYSREKQELTLVKSVWAEVKPMRGFEYLEYYREKNKVNVKVTIRYIEGITEDMLVEIDGVFHEITAVIDIEYSHVALEIMCQERVNDKKA